MFSVTTPTRSSAFSRREILQIGGLSLCGINMADLAMLRAGQPDIPERYRSCVFLFLFGGPSQIDLWDMKPEATAEIRGEFKPVSTNVPGIQICEHLPRLGKQMDKICLLRSMTHNMNVHGPACSEIFSGREYFGAPTTDQANEQDWPSLSSMVMRYGQPRGPLPSSVVLPWYLQFPGQSRRIAGQTGGRMGERHNALLIKGDSKTRDFQVNGLQLRESVSLDRLHRRRALLSNLSSNQTRLSETKLIEQYQGHHERAYHLLKNRAGRILNLADEKKSVRESYGNTMVGQSLLMARRLVEAGVSLVTVNWEDETKIDGVNTCWDTHQNNFPKLKNLLCPIFDQAFPTFIQDLSDRGLLETTLVVAVGEFGRTPHMGQFSQSANTKKSGRDHWPSAFTALLAGGGVQGGQVYGASDQHAAIVKDKPVSPADLAATVFHHLGINHQDEYRDEVQGLRHQLAHGRPVTDLG